MIAGHVEKGWSAISTTNTILVIEDEADIARFIKGYLEREGFYVITKNNGQEGLNYALQHPLELIILDWMLPELNGLSLLKKLRREQQTPVLMLSARIDELDRILGLEFGADDYLTKPFHPGELVARVKALLRRASPHEDTKLLILGNLVLDKSRYTVTIKHHLLDLTVLEFKLLEVLIGQPERVFSRDELLSRVWGDNFMGVERVVDVRISNLRQKLAKHNLSHMLETVRGVGYRVSNP